MGNVRIWCSWGRQIANWAEECEDAGTWDELSVDVESEGEMLDYSVELVCW